MGEARGVMQLSLPKLGLVAPPGAFRLMLAFAVVLSHMSGFDVGRLAVLLFFFLSGYWTARIYQEKFGGNRVGLYYLSRYWRIAPLFFIITVAAALARNQWDDMGWTNLTLLGIASWGYDPTGVSWSLDVELQFYLLLPLALAFLVRAPKVTLLASVVIGAFGWWLHERHDIVTVAKFLPVFMLGALTHVAAWKPGNRSAMLSLGAFIAMTAVTAATPFFRKSTPDPFDHDIWGMIWLLPLLPYVAHSLTIRSTSFDRHLGNLSYPLYLVHYPVIALMASAYGHGLPSKLATLVISVILAVLTYFLLDRPLDRIRVRVTERNSV
ncbi:acyltransferase family protein [Phenylobacterium kunshanense]|uniref:Acyltransferase 3 domain-containing protein n=1 Tax=Phenylobacterium kunshanense TaxID=1445034 RepID=A0A328BKM7_9CAUL|nr:acyltransferase [Phenylobacterium kunshanense]RAK66546.1 hypothetical protein DJ019_09925 [Phenylobacterium kunshanense]